MMNSFLRLISGAAILLAASVASAANPVPGLEVLTKKGNAVVFRGVTNTKGRFETGPLEPGVYTVEVRTMPNTPPSSARFFLALAGAKPVGEATIRPGVAVAMEAMVRNPAGIRGQVTARGGIVYVPRPSPTHGEHAAGQTDARAEFSARAQRRAEPKNPSRPSPRWFPLDPNPARARPPSPRRDRL